MLVVDHEQELGHEIVHEVGASPQVCIKGRLVVQLALNRARGNITDQVARYKRFKLDSSSCKQ